MKYIIKFKRMRYFKSSQSSLSLVNDGTNRTELHSAQIKLPLN